MSCVVWSKVLAITAVYIVASNGFAQNTYDDYYDAGQGVQSPYGSYDHSDNVNGGNYPQYKPGQGFPPSPHHTPFYEPSRGSAGENYWPSPSEYQLDPYASGYAHPASPYYPPPIITTPPITSTSATILPTTPASGSALTDTERGIVLNAHNNYRRTLANGNSPNNDGTMMPQGANILQLQYDPSIETIAQNWASGCVFEHSTEAQRNFTGENLYQITTQQDAAAALQAAADLWWSELAQFGMNPDLNLTAAEVNKGIGHWSQVILGSKEINL
ncbi:cysteine-rich secretory protein family domain-containing protein [Ditylenchus destructor]|nr:cysteine-rich secretory protein family domain-containing protein [Ditylenchus destructor]